MNIADSFNKIAGVAAENNEILKKFITSVSLFSKAMF